MRGLPSLAWKWSRRVDRRVDRLFARAEPALVRLRHAVGPAWARWSRRLGRVGGALYARAGRMARWAGRRLRPLGVAGLRALAFADRRARSAGARAARAATRASGVITPERAICGVIVASAACLLCSQFVDYRAVEVGRPGYAGLPSAASAPTVGAETPVDAHSYLLVAVAALAGALGVAAARTGRRRLGRVVFLLGLLSVAVVLLVDRPAGLDAGSQASIFSGAAAVLQAGFYAELAAAGGLMLGGMLLTAAPRARKSKVSRRDRPRKVDASRWFRLRKPSLARTQGGLASERTFHVREQAGRLRT